jgi:hypothetical protein
MPERHSIRPAALRPRVTLGLLYLFAFFLLYALLLVVPELSALARPAAPADEAALEQAAFEAARRAFSPARMLVALLAALATVFVAARGRRLPGLR